MPNNSNAITPAHSQDHGGDVRTSSESPKGPVRLTNGSERDECSGAVKTKSHPAAVGSATSRRRPDISCFRNGRRSSFERNNFRSSLQTIESLASSLDIYDDEDDASNLGRSVNSSNSSSLPSNHRCKRRHSLDMGGSSNNSLMVSFSKLNEQELSHLRKWNRRLQRTEVFDKYYFPAKWEANEMESLVGFLKLEDPSSKIGGGMRGGSLRASGKKGRKSALSESGVRRGRSGTSSSWQSGESNATDDGGLSSSFSSTFKSAGKLSKLLTDPIQNTVDPAKITRKALNFIFFPYVHDPKSVLLKRGSVFLHDTSLHNERELMIFTHGFLLANVVLEDAFSLFLALSDREFLTEKSFLDYLQNKFREMDEENSGEIEKWELQRLFTDMGIPMGENVLDELIQRSVIFTTPLGRSEKVDWEALHNALQGFFAQRNNSSSSSINSKSSGLDDSEHDANGLKKLLDRFQRRKTTKVEYASLFSNVARVDSLDICHGDDLISREIANSAYAQTVFSVTLNDRKNDPLIFVCSKPEHRNSWVDAFKPGLVSSLMKSSAKGMTELRSQLGWQHLVVRSSFVTLVILNEVRALESALKEDSLDGNSHRKLRLELNLLDEHNGYSPLHYATILGHTNCMVVLLKAGAKVTLEDREGLSPMYHALSLRNDEVANVLEKFGADRSDDLRKVIAREIEAEELKHEHGGLKTHVENCALDRSGSVKEENIEELLMQAANQFGGVS
mmetsp:Transcript_56541/g.120084  ORF Transcript_56541/g.120084 Transcript_56541/m.120084 type:complete len:732 (+) Transcript_56541:26-2221(+)